MVSSGVSTIDTSASDREILNVKTKKVSSTLENRAVRKKSEEELFGNKKEKRSFRLKDRFRRPQTRPTSLLQANSQMNGCVNTILRQQLKIQGGTVAPKSEKLPVKPGSSFFPTRRDPAWPVIMVWTAPHASPHDITCIGANDQAVHLFGQRHKRIIGSACPDGKGWAKMADPRWDDYFKCSYKHKVFVPNGFVFDHQKISLPKKGRKRVRNFGSIGSYVPVIVDGRIFIISVSTCHSLPDEAQVDGVHGRIPKPDCVRGENRITPDGKYEFLDMSSFFPPLTEEFILTSLKVIRSVIRTILKGKAEEIIEWVRWTARTYLNHCFPSRLQYQNQIFMTRTRTFISAREQPDDSDAEAERLVCYEENAPCKADIPRVRRNSCDFNIEDAGSGHVGMFDPCKLTESGCIPVLKNYQDPQLIDDMIARMSLEYMAAYGAEAKARQCIGTMQEKSMQAQERGSP